MEGILQEEMTPLNKPDYEAWLYRQTYKVLKCQTLSIVYEKIFQTWFHANCLNS